MRDFVSQRAYGVDASGIRKVFDLAAALPDPINLSIGLPDFDVPQSIKTAAIEAIQHGHNRYTPTQGIAPLRERLQRSLSKEHGKDVGEVLITSGVSGGLLLAMMAMIDPGDEVIFLDPYFAMYRHLMTMTGGRGVIVDSYPDFKFRALDVEKAITKKTKVLMLNSPGNPTGIVMSEGEVRAAVELAEKHDLLILSDEIYEPFRYEKGRELYSPLKISDRVLSLRGFSKSHAMTGWRVSYAYGFDAITQQMAKLQQYSYVCAPTPFQHAAIAACDVDMQASVDEYKKKRDLVVELLSPNFEINVPGGAFYVFPKVPGTMSAAEFCTLAIQNNVLIIPGNVFSGRDTHFRISYATTEAKLREGCEILNRLAREIV